MMKANFIGLSNKLEENALLTQHTNGTLLDKKLN